MLKEVRIENYKSIQKLNLELGRIKEKLQLIDWFKDFEVPENLSPMQSSLQLGHTKARRILKPEPLEGQETVKLSEAFLRGYIGGLPKNF